MTEREIRILERLIDDDGHCTTIEVSCTTCPVAATMKRPGCSRAQAKATAESLLGITKLEELFR
jgi:hypothetical protein